MHGRGEAGKADEHPRTMEWWGFREKGKRKKNKKEEELEEAAA